MSATKKILIFIFSILLIGVLVFLVTWGVINFNKVKDLMSGTGIYNKTDVDNAYNDGYNTALKDKEEWDKLLNDYKDTIAVQTDTISQLNSEKATLDKSIKDYKAQVTNLTEERTDLENQVKLLNEQIASLNDTITADAVEKQALIEQHTQTVSRLNAQIMGLNGQIEELNDKINANTVVVSSLNDKIAELQGTIAKYQEFISQFETEDKAIVTFEFAGSVYSVQVVEKGSKVIVETPASSDYVIFNGWTLNGEAVDLSTYTVTETVRIVADVTYKYVVTFTVDGNVKFTQVVEKGNYVTEVPTVKKTGYTFKYWTLDGVTEVHFEQLPITSNTTFIAKFNQLHNVDFIYENGESIINTKRVEHGTVTTAPRISLSENEVFFGWKLNGNYVDVANYIVNSDVVFVADISICYNVSFYAEPFKVGVAAEPFDIKQVRAGSTVSTDYVPSMELYEFDSWGVRGFLTVGAVDLSTYAINSDTEIYPIMVKVASYVTVYDGDTCLYSEIHKFGENITFDVEPLGRDGYRFMGYFNPDYDNTTSSNLINFTKPRYTYTVKEYSNVLYAYYSAKGAGKFVAEDGKYIDFFYDQKTPTYGGTAYLNITTDISKWEGFPQAVKDNANYDFKNGTFNFDYSSLIWFTGVYSEHTDSWTFTRFINYNGEIRQTTYVFYRSGYNYGTFYDELLK